MADVQQVQIAAPVPTDIKLYTASGTSLPAENVSPAVTMTSPVGITMVTSGTRPLLFSSSAPAVDGIAEPNQDNVVHSPPITVQTASGAATTGIQINTSSSGTGSGIVIRAASSSSATPAAEVVQTSSPAAAAAGNAPLAGQTITIPQPTMVQVNPASGSGSGSVGVSSGITIRSSASPTQVAPALPLLNGYQSDAITTSDQSIVSHAIPPVHQNLTHQVLQQPQQVQVAASGPAPTPSLPVQTTSSGISMKTTSSSGFVSQQPNDIATLHQPSPVVASTSGAVRQDGVIRAPLTSASGHKSAAAERRQEEQPMTLSELINKFDLVTVCGFTLAVLSVAFASILTGHDLSIGWLMVIVAAASVGAFVRFRL